MSLYSWSRPSPALVVAVIALTAAFAGTAIAGPDAITSALNKAKVKQIAKKQGKKQANKQIRKKAPGLSVANAVNAQNATNATTAANGVAGYGNFNPNGSVQPGAFNMNNTVIGGAPFIYCEDQAFKSVQATGGITPGGQAGGASAISRQQLIDLGASMTTIGCAASDEWAYVTYTATGGGAGTFGPSYFQALGL
jgi:hypothetical protein